MQPLGKHTHKNRVERKRAAFKRHRRFDLKPLSQSSDRLLGYGVKSRQSQIRLGDPLIQQGLDICLRIHAAPSGDIIDAGSLPGQRVKLLNRNL